MAGPRLLLRPCPRRTHFVPPLRALHVPRPSPCNSAGITYCSGHPDIGYNCSGGSKGQCDLKKDVSGAMYGDQLPAFSRKYVGDGWMYGIKQGYAGQ